MSEMHERPGHSRSSTPRTVTGGSVDPARHEPIAGSLPSIDRTEASSTNMRAEEAPCTRLTPRTVTPDSGVPVVQASPADEGSLLLISSARAFSLIEDGRNNLRNGHVLRGLGQLITGGASVALNMTAELLLSLSIGTAVCAPLEVSLGIGAFFAAGAWWPIGAGILALPLAGGLLYGMSRGITKIGECIPNPAPDASCE